MVQSLPSLVLHTEFSGCNNASCGNGAATRVTVTDFLVEGVVLSLFQGLQFLGPYVFGLLLPG